MVASNTFDMMCLWATSFCNLEALIKLFSPDLLIPFHLILFHQAFVPPSNNFAKF